MATIDRYGNRIAPRNKKPNTPASIFDNGLNPALPGYDPAKAAAANAPATPPPATAANGFGTNIQPYESPYDQLIEQRYQETQAPVNRDQIRKQKVSQFQAEIDATNQIYSNLLAKAEVEGTGRLGQQRAIAARSGNLGSIRGEAQKEQVNTYNREITSDIGARQQLAVGGLMNEARQLADQEIQQREAARSAGADQYLEYLAGAEERKATNASTVFQSLLAQGLSLEDISPEDFTELANSLGMRPDQLANVYKGELASAKAASETTQYERSLKEREFGLKEGEFGLKAGEFEFNQEKFQAELDLKYQELNRLINNDQLDAISKNAEIQKKMAEIDKINSEIGAGTAASGLAPKEEATLNNATSAFDAVNGLLSHPGLGAAVGKSSLFNFIPGTSGANFVAQLDRVKSLLALPELDKLRGLGAMSDREFKTITDSVGALSPKMSDGEFKQELERIKGVLEKTKTNLEAKALLNQFESGGSEGANPKAPAMGPSRSGSTPYLKTLGPVTGPDGSAFWKWGLDVDLKKGDPVKAPGDGKILAINRGYNGGFGNQVKLRMEDGRELWLSHMDKLPLNAKPGTPVRSGQVIAIGGNTGKTYSTGKGDGSHVDITMPKPGGGYYTAREVKSYLDNKFV